MKYLENILRAPRRGRRSRRSLPLWQQYLEEGDVCPYLAAYTPEDIDEIDDLDFLKKMYLVYTFTNDSPSEKEKYYMLTMSLCAAKKLAKLKVFPPYVVDYRNIHF